MISANQAPDHTTIARFRQRHETRARRAVRRGAWRSAPRPAWSASAWSRSTARRSHANASQHATRSYEQIAREILDEAAPSTRDEDERFGERARRRAAAGAARPRRAAAGGCARPSGASTSARAAEAKPIPRLAARAAARRPSAGSEEEHQVECRANAAYEAYRRARADRNGRPALARTVRRSPITPPATPAGKINLTDPDSRNVKTPRGWVQGYNAQAVTTEDQIVIAAEVHISSAGLRPARADGRRRPPRARARPASTETPEVVLADAGYWHQRPDASARRRGIRRCSSRPTPTSATAPGPAGTAASTTFMRRVLATDRGRRALRQAPRHDRAGLRRHQVQPRRRPLPTPRPRRRTLGMAAASPPPTTCSSSGDTPRRRCPPEAPARAPLLQTRFR